MRVELPIKGTRLKPRMSFPEQLAGRLVGEAAKLLLKEQAENRLKDLIDARTRKPPRPDTPAGEAPATAEDLLIRGIFDILEEVTKQKENPGKP